MKTYTVYWVDNKKPIRTVIDRAISKESAKRKFKELHPEAKILRINKNPLVEYSNNEPYFNKKPFLIKNLLLWGLCE
jgi:hypothetical protein